MKVNKVNVTAGVMTSVKIRGSEVIPFYFKIEGGKITVFETNQAYEVQVINPEKKKEN